MNLMMSEKIDDQSKFFNKAIDLYNRSDLLLAKGLVQFTVRSYYLNHNVKMVGEGQAVWDKIIGYGIKKDVKELKVDMIKSRLKSIKSIDI
jgi:hypothetical protein